MASPRISVVIVGRNDTYGTNFIERMNIFIRSLDYHTIRHPDLLELVIVNWNPLPDRAQLQEVIEIAKNFTIRIITVPHDVHVTVPDVTAPVLEFWGKNVGIRRSVGEYVLVSNPDILFTQEMVDFLATETFNEKTVYRTDRYDYHGDGITDFAELYTTNTDPLLFDSNGNGVDDLSELLNPTVCGGDLNFDNVSDVSDLLLLLQFFGTSCD